MESMTGTMDSAGVVVGDRSASEDETSATQEHHAAPRSNESGDCLLQSRAPRSHCEVHGVVHGRPLQWTATEADDTGGASRRQRRQAGAETTFPLMDDTAARRPCGPSLAGCASGPTVGTGNGGSCPQACLPRPAQRSAAPPRRGRHRLGRLNGRRSPPGPLGPASVGLGRGSYSGDAQAENPTPHRRGSAVR